MNNGNNILLCLPMACMQFIMKLYSIGNSSSTFSQSNWCIWDLACSFQKKSEVQRILFHPTRKQKPLISVITAIDFYDPSTASSLSKVDSMQLHLRECPFNRAAGVSSWSTTCPFLHRALIGLGGMTVFYKSQVDSSQRDIFFPHVDQFVSFATSTSLFAAPVRFMSS